MLRLNKEAAQLLGLTLLTLVFPSRRARVKQAMASSRLPSHFATSAMLFSAATVAGCPRPLTDRQCEARAS